MLDKKEKRFYSSINRRHTKENSYYYVHLHAENIGKFYDKDESEGVRLFKDHRDMAYRAMKGEVLKSWRKSITPVNSKMISVLDEIFDASSQSSQNDVAISQIDKQIQKFVENMLSNNTSERFLAAEKTAKAVDVSSILHNGNTMHAIQELDRLMQIIAEGVRLLKSPLSEPLAVALLQSQQGKIKVKSVKGYSRNVINALNDFKKNNHIVSGSDIEAALNALEILSANINTKTTQDGTPLTVDGLKSTIEYVFTNGMSEYVIANSINNTVLKYQNVLAKVVGSKPGVLAYTPDKEVGKPSTGKTDVAVKNVKLHCTSGILANQELQVEVGLSVKNYITKGFQYKGKNLPKTISSGSGGTLKRAFQDTFGNNAMAQYYAYNTMAHRVQLNNNSLSQAFNDILTARMFRRLFMQRNTNEFSQILVVNGQVVSFWEILMSLANAGSGSLSSSRASQQIVSISIPDTSKIKNVNGRIENANIEKGTNKDGTAWVAVPWARSKRVNEVINKAKIFANIHLDKYYNMINTRK